MTTMTTTTRTTSRRAFLLTAIALAMTSHAIAEEKKPKGTIVVPANVVARAIQQRDITATNATKPDGAKLAGVGKYGVGLKDGDVVVSVNGTRTPNVGAMVAAGLGAAQAGASKISGKIVRGDATYAVVLELPRQP
jgi:hypothetical protein